MFQGNRCEQKLLQPGQIISDTELAGFRVRAAKLKTYSVQKRVGNKVLTRTIGRHGIYTPDAARREAQKILLQLSQGHDPLVIERKNLILKSLTFGSLVDLYEEKLNNANTINDVRSRVRGRLSSWLMLPANDITRSMVAIRFKELSLTGPTQAALVMRYARAIYNHGIAHYRDDKTGESLIIQNPTKILSEKRQLKQSRRRDTYLKPNNLSKWYKALVVAREYFPIACDYFLVTLFLGCRRNESAELKWSNVDLEHKMVVFRDTKNKTDHHLPLGDYLTKLLQERRNADEKSEYVFPSGSKAGYISEPRPAINKMAEESGFAFLVGDLRRTFATLADGLGFSRYAIKRLLNHSNNGGNDVTEGYIGLDVERQRQNMQEIENNLLRAMGVGGNSLASQSVVK